MKRLLGVALAAMSSIGLAHAGTGAGTDARLESRDDRNTAMGDVAADLLAAVPVLAAATGPGFPPVPRDPDVVLDPGDDIVAKFSELRAGETMVINPGVYPMGELGLRDLKLKRDATYYLREGAWFEGWRRLETWRAVGGRWRAEVPRAIGPDKCFCGDEDRYVDKKRNPLAKNRAVLVRRLKGGDFDKTSMLIETDSPTALTQSNWRSVDGSAEVAWDPGAWEVYVTHSDFAFNDGAPGVKLYAESHNAGFRGFATPTHQGAVKIVARNGKGAVLWGGTYELNHAAGIRLSCGLAENVVLRWNGHIGMLGSQGSCSWPRQSQVTFQYRNDDGRLVEKTETFNDNVMWSTVYENNLLLYRSSWVGGGAKIGLDSIGNRAAYNVMWGNDGPDIWFDNVDGGRNIADHNLLKGSRVGGGFASEFQQRLDGSRFSTLYYENWILHKWPGFKVNRGALKFSRQADGAAVRNFVVIDGFVENGRIKCGDGWADKQRDHPVGSDRFFNVNNQFTDNIFVHRHACDSEDWHGFSGAWIDRQTGPYQAMQTRADWNLYVFQEGNPRERFMRDLSDNSGGDNNETRVDFATFQGLGFEAHGQELVVPNVDAWLCANHREKVEALALDACE